MQRELIFHEFPKMMNQKISKTNTFNDKYHFLV